MPNAAGYRRQAEMFRRIAAATTDEELALANRLRAVEYDHLAEEAERGDQVQQRGTQQPPPVAPANSDQPAQQQQQAQPKKSDE